MTNPPDNSFARPILIALSAILLAVGTLMVYSSSMSSRSTDVEQIYLLRHLMFLGIAITAGTVASVFPSSLWYRVAPAFFLVTIVLLLLVLMPGFGHRVNGAQRWLRFGTISFQPSELAKLTIPLFVVWNLFDRNENFLGTSLLRLTRIAGCVAVPISFVLIEPDLGTTLFLILIFAFTFFVAGCPVRVFAFGGLLLLPALGGLLILKPYQLARITGFVETWTHPESAPYQVRQSLTTLGVGGIEGTGLGRGWQKLSFLPEANTDFIFAVIGEEMGFLGTAGVIAAWLGIYVAGSKLIRTTAPRTFSSVLATVLLTQLVLQAALNVAVVTAMVPPKGISHPLISYGGSNLVTSVVALGMILSLTRREQTQRLLITFDREIENIKCDYSPTIFT